MVNRLIEPTSGEIIIDGRNVLEEDPVQLRRRIGYVIQQAGLFPHMDVGENISVTGLSRMTSRKLLSLATSSLC